MRWGVKPQPNLGDIRTVSRFLLLPKCLNGQWRWLERVIIQQHFRFVRHVSKLNPTAWDYPEWVDTGWIDGITSP